MKDTVKDGPALHASPHPKERFWRELRDLGYVVVLIGLLCGAWKYYAHQRELAAADWLRNCASIQDPWQRFSKLSLEERPSLDDEQVKYINEQSAAALESALAESSDAAFDHVERHEGWYIALLDKYPRDALQRKVQLDALWIVWPSIHEMPTADRMELVHMATRCHLHEAEEPVAGETVLACLHYGAGDLGTEKALKRLLDSARLSRSLTANP